MDSENDRDIDQCFRLLALCARAEGHPAFYEQLAEQVRGFTAWEVLPEQAELHGMGPLLRHHLKAANIAIPVETMRTLDGLYLRQREINRIHKETLLEVVSSFEEAGIQALVLKGLALAYGYYPKPALRPVSDIDLLLQKDDFAPALKILESSGYGVHAPASHSTRFSRSATATVTGKPGNHTEIDLHYRESETKFPFRNTPFDEFVRLDGQPVQITIDRQTIYAPAVMDNFYYLWAHLLKHLLIRPPARKVLQLKWVADIINVVEQSVDEIDWAYLYRARPDIMRRLEILYSLTPAPERVQKVMSIKQISPLEGANQYPQGWPSIYVPQKKEELWHWLRQTFTAPSTWWLRLYYGIPERSVTLYGQVIYRVQILSMMIWKLIKKLVG